VAVDPNSIDIGMNAIVRPFDFIQASDYYETYPIHYFTRPSKSSTSNGLTSCITATVGDICYVTESGNTGYWKLNASNPTQLSSWIKILDAQVNITGLLFFDQYVATTTRTITMDTLPIKVWVRVCSVDDSGNLSSWSVSGPFYTRDIFKPQNVILDYDNTEIPEFDLGDPSTSGISIVADGGEPVASSFQAIIDANLDQVILLNAEDNTSYLLGQVYGVSIQWNEVLNPDNSINQYEVELQGGRMFAQVWNDSLHYWGNTVSQDVVFGGLSDSINDSDLTMSVTELSNVPAPEFYIRVDDEIMYVTNVVRDWNDEKTFVNAIYEVDRAQLGTIAAPHTAGSLIYKVQVEPLQVLELYESPSVPFEISIGGEK
ncbi:MAG: hypothetical protein ACKO7N_03995, partial [Candidatus Nitrosotenuis sp.]